MLPDRKKTDFGVVRIHNGVICSIASFAAMEVKGVLRMSSRRLKNILSLFKKNTISRGVKVEFKENNEVNLSLSIVVEYGANIPYISNLVQENVKKRVEELTGLVVNEVEVNINDVAISQSEK